MELIILVKLGLFLGLVLMSGFFAGSETALFSLSPVQLMRLEEERHPKAALLRALLAQPRRLIATIFIGNELVNIAASALMASVTHHYLARRGDWVVLLVSTAISIVLILYLGEITPKNTAVRMVDRWACAAARPLWVLAAAMAPVRWVVEKIADLVVLAVGRRIAPTRGPAVGEGEFLTMVDAVHAGGELDARESRLIHKVFEFGDRRVSEVMTPVDRVFALSASLSVGRVLEEVRGSIYSRVPLYQTSRDRIVGVLYAKDLIAVAFRLGRRAPRLQELVHPAYFVPKTTKCEQLFREFRRRRMHLALVVDEYGHFVGLVTMEDLLEEVFGEIKDEKELPSPTGEMRPLTPPDPEGGPPSGGPPPEGPPPEGQP